MQSGWSSRLGLGGLGQPQTFQRGRAVYAASPEGRHSWGLRDGATLDKAKRRYRTRAGYDRAKPQDWTGYEKLKSRPRCRQARSGPNGERTPRRAPQRGRELRVPTW